MLLHGSAESLELDCSLLDGVRALLSKTSRSRNAHGVAWIASEICLGRPLRVNAMIRRYASE